MDVFESSWMLPSVSSDILSSDTSLHHQHTCTWSVLRQDIIRADLHNDMICTTMRLYMTLHNCCL
jgi:hypothetical protein